MKVLGVIVEYNPFHNGHLHHLSKSISKSQATHSIAIMSGPLVQRGEPASIDQWTRAKMAVDNGINLVIQLPVVHSIASAESFAYGAVHLLNQLKVVDELIFGSESGNLKDIRTIADYLTDESDEFKDNLKIHLAEGLSYPQARTKSLEKMLPIQSTIQSNDILGIEYIKAMNRLNCNFTCDLIQREKVDYHSTHLENSFSSATAIREWIKSSAFEMIEKAVPPKSYQAISEYKAFIFLDDFYPMLRYRLLHSSPDDLEKINEVSEGLENRLISAMKTSTNMEDFLNHVKIKRFTMTRIKRIIFNILLDIKKEDIIKYDLLNPKAIRILAADQKGLEIIRLLNMDESLNIITNMSKFRSDDINLNKQLSYDLLGSDLCSIIRNQTLGQDYLNTPYIKK